MPQSTEPDYSLATIARVAMDLERHAHEGMRAMFPEMTDEQIDAYLHGSGEFGYEEVRRGPTEEPTSGHTGQPPPVVDRVDDRSEPNRRSDPDADSAGEGGGDSDRLQPQPDQAGDLGSAGVEHGILRSDTSHGGGLARVTRTLGHPDERIFDPDRLRCSIDGDDLVVRMRIDARPDLVDPSFIDLRLTWADPRRRLHYQRRFWDNRTRYRHEVVEARD